MFYEHRSSFHLKGRERELGGRREGRKEGETNFPSAGALSQWLQQPRLGQIKARSQESCAGLHMGGRDPST